MLAEVAPDAEGRVRPELAPASRRRRTRSARPGSGCRAGADAIAGVGARRGRRRARPTSSTSAPAPPRRVDVNMVEVGEPRTIVPALRARPRERADRARARARRRSAPSWSACCARRRPEGAEVTIEVELAEPALFDPADPALQLAPRRWSAPAARRPALVRLGGTLPLLAVLADRGMTSIVSGFALPDDAFHAPNESYRLESLRLGRGGGARAVRGAGRAAGASRPCSGGPQPVDTAARGAVTRGLPVRARTCQRPPAARARGSPPRACGRGRRSARGPSRRPGAAAARAACRRCAARRGRPRRSRSATARARRSASGAPQATSAVSISTSLSAALAAVARTASGDQSVASTRPPASAAAMLGRPRPQPSSSTRAPRRERRATSCASATALAHSSAQ